MRALTDCTFMHGMSPKCNGAHVCVYALGLEFIGDFYFKTCRNFKVSGGLTHLMFCMHLLFLQVVHSSRVTDSPLEVG